MNSVSTFNLEGQKIQMPVQSVRKQFKVRDHVKVMSGKNTDVLHIRDSLLTQAFNLRKDMDLHIRWTIDLLTHTYCLIASLPL